MGKEYNSSRVRDILAVLMNSVNNDILALLSTGEYNTREIARILGRDEGDISRRLNRMKKIGLVEAKWTRIGNRNVKLYRLKSHRLIIRFSSKGLDYSLDDSERGVIEHKIDFSPKPPRSKMFIGREKELELLSRNENHVVLITGLPGVGKTSLALKYYEKHSSSPKYWYSMSELDYLNFFVKKLALYFSSQGYRKLVDYIATSRIEAKEAVRYIVEGIDKLSLLLVIDDYQKCKDNMLRELIANVASNIVNGKLVVISRTVPLELASLKNLVRVHLRGLDYTSAYKLLKTLGVEVDHETFTEIYIATQGHPGLLTLVAKIAFSEGIDKTMNLLLQGNISRRLWDTIYSYLSIGEKDLLKTLLCFNEPISRNALEEIHSDRNTSRNLYMLLDKGLIREIEGSYIAVDLIRNLASPIRDGSLCKHYYRLIGDYYLSQRNIEEFFKAFKYYILANHPKGIVKAIKHRIKHVAYRILDYIRIYEMLLHEARNNIKDYTALGYIDYELGLVYLNKSLLSRAKKFLDNALKVMSNIGDYELVAAIKAKQPILVEENLISLDEALKQAQEALEIAEKFNDPVKAEIEYDVYSNLTRLYAWIGDMDKAFKAVTNEVEASKRCQDPFLNAIARFHLAIVKQISGLNESVLEDLLESYSLFRVSGSKDFTAKAAAMIARLLFCEDRYSEALRYAEEAIEILKSAHKWGMLCETYPYYLLSLRILGQRSKVVELSKEVHNVCKNIKHPDAKQALLTYHTIQVLEGEEASKKVLEAVNDIVETVKSYDECIVNRIVKLLEDNGLNSLGVEIKSIIEKYHSSTTLTP